MFDSLSLSQQDLNFKSLFLGNLSVVLFAIFGKKHHSEVQCWFSHITILRALRSSVRLLPVSLHICFPNLHQSLFFLASLCRTIFPLVLSILLPIASNINLYYLFYLPCDSLRFSSPMKSLSSYKQPSHSFTNPIPVLSVIASYLIKTSIPTGIQWPGSESSTLTGFAGSTGEFAQLVWKSPLYCIYDHWTLLMVLFFSCSIIILSTQILTLPLFFSLAIISPFYRQTNLIASISILVYITEISISSSVLLGLTSRWIFNLTFLTSEHNSLQSTLSSPSNLKNILRIYFELGHVHWFEHKNFMDSNHALPLEIMWS